MVQGSRMAMLEQFDYYITEYGKAYTLEGFELSTRTDRDGYKSVRLSKNGKSHTCYTHRLIAEVFLPKEAGRNEVNHIDGNKQNNTVANLEWVNHSENVKHAHLMGLIDKSKVSRQVIDTSTGQLFASIREAADTLGINYNTCRNILSGTNKNNSTLKYVN